MNENLTSYFKTTIRELVEHTRGSNAWVSIWYPTYELLEKLSPSIPEDNTSGFIAYSVGDNPYKRVKIKTSRFLGKKLNLNTGFVSEKDLQHCTDCINAKLFPNLKIELVKGSTITEYYSEGVGGSSCMTGYNSENVDMYERNPDIYSMLAMFSGNGNARAMVIKLDNGSFLMDRVYSDNQYLIDEMFLYARKQGWYYRTYTRAGGYEISFAGGEITDYGIMIVSNIEYIDGRVPFADTLTQYENCGDTLNISHGQFSVCMDGVLDQTDGYLNGDEHSTCANCGSRVHNDDITCVDDNWICRDCYGENYFYCGCCDESHHDDDGVLISSVSATVCSDCISEYFYCCDDCGEYYTENDILSTEDGYICSSCYEADYFTCEGCDTVTPDSEHNEGSDGESYCSTCIEDHIDNDEQATERTEDKARQDIEGQAVMEFKTLCQHVFTDINDGVMFTGVQTTDD